jgi:hypothetical protein
VTSHRNRLNRINSGDKGNEGRTELGEEKIWEHLETGERGITKTRVGE